jgi:hypothetical protein
LWERLPAELNSILPREKIQGSPGSGGTTQNQDQLVGTMHNSTSGFRIEDVVRSTMKRPSEDYLRLGHEFGNYHKDPANVLLHFVSTPLGLIGAISLLRSATNSSSVAMSAVFLYLLSLLPIVPNGDFYGTAIFCGLIVLAARLLKLGTITAASLIVLGYVLQDLAHLGTGESTFQSTYSEGGHVSIDFI